MRKVGNIVAGFWDFLSTLVDSKKDKDGNSVVVKNYISGNNNQKNTTHNHNDRRKLAEAMKPSQSPRGPKTNVTSPVCVSLQCIRLYSTGSKGKVYTDKFYKSINHNFGIEVILKNTSSQAQTIHLGHCIYDEKGNIVFKKNFTPHINPNSTLMQHIFVDADAFSKMKSGKYKSQFWINNTRVQRTFFTVVYK